MTTDISPIFGLITILLEELLKWAGFLGAMTVAIVIGVFNFLHLRHQKKVESAKVLRELYKPWREDNELKDLLVRISDPHITSYDPIEIDRFLNKFEAIATFWDGDVLIGAHVKSTFSANLRWIRKDIFIQRYMDDAKKKDKNTFSYLRKLLKESEKWDSP